MNAKYYIYRNLHKNKFSIKYRGRVINRAKYIIGLECFFKVNEKGRRKVLRERRKNVHAYVTCNSFLLSSDSCELDLSDKEEVYYNPYINSSFALKDTNDIITSNHKVYLYHNKIYIDKVPR